MRTPAQALMWELWRCSRWELILRVAGQCVLCMGVFHFLDDDRRQLLAGIFLAMLTGTALFTGNWISSLDNKQSGFPFYLGFTRPIHTALLVACPIIYVALTTSLTFLVPAALLKYLYGIPYPLLAIAACLATASACLVCAAWSPRRILTRSMFLLVICAVCYVAVSHWTEQAPREGLPLLFSTERWAEVPGLTSIHYAVLFGLFAGAVAITTFAVGRQRHGESLGFGQFPAVFRGDLVDALPKREHPFGSSFGAQFWFEMRCSGYRVLTVASLAAAVCFLFTTGTYLWGGGESRTAYLSQWPLMVGLSPLVYVVLGADGVLGLQRRQGAVWLSAFDATRAVENDRLVAIKLGVLTTSALAGWLLMLGAAAAWTVIFGDVQDWREAANNIMPFLKQVSGQLSAGKWVVIVFVAAVLYVSGCAQLLAAGWWMVLYPTVFATAGIAAFFHLALAALDIKHGWDLDLLWIDYAWFFSAAIVGLTVLALARALRMGFLRRRTFAIAFVSWVVFLAALTWLYLEFVPESMDLDLPAHALALGAATLILPLGATAFAPLAIASHRHR